jgi:hypothetical protein
MAPNQNRDTQLLNTQNFHKLSLFLAAISKLPYWKNHFASYNFKLELNKFSPDYWKSIPYFTIDDYLEYGLETYLKNINSAVKKNIYQIVLRIPYRKIKQQHVLFLDIIPSSKPTRIKNQVTAQLMESFNNNLIRILQSIHPKSKDQLIILDSKSVNNKTIPILQELQVNTLYTDPENFMKSVHFLAGIPLSTIIFFHPPFTETLTKLTDQYFPNATVQTVPPLVRLLSATIFCPHAQKNFGKNAIHPGDGTLIEIRGRGPNGYGEIIITTTKPLKLSWVRFRSGILGKACLTKCKCGQKWVLILKKIRTYQN